MKKFMKIRKITVLTLTVAVLAGIIGTAGMAQTDRRSANIKSKGIIDFENGTTIIDASDFIYLADEIDLLEDTYKTETVNALNQIGTFYNLDGTTTFNKDESTLSAANAAILPFSAITNGIIHSQSIPTERTYSGTLPGETIETSGNIAAATAANLSLGTAAWVDGELIVGTGADNNSYYTQGVNDGIASSDIHIARVSAGDIKSQLPNVWNKLSTDNFFTRIDYVYGSSESDGTGGGSTSYNQKFTMSYNSTLGVLTVDTTTATGITYHSNGTGSTRGEAGVNYSIWCVY